MINEKASLVQIPSGYKGGSPNGTLYSVLPANGDGDFDHTRASSATRVNKDGLIETVAADVPRLNYNFIDGVVQPDPHLLLEPQRTNSLPESENFSTNWVAIDATLSSGISSPDGGTNAYSLIEGTGTGGKIIYDTISVSAGSVTYSLFMKKGDKRYTALLLSGVVTTSMFNVDLENGTGTTVTGSFDSTNIEEYPNGWYRISVTATATAGNLNCNVYLMNGSTYNDRNYTGNGTDKTFIFGAQLEAGSLTSYIPTNGSAVTRTVDTCNIPNYANLPTDYPITVYWKGQVKEFNGFNCAFSIYKDGASGEFLVVSFQSSSQILVRRTVGGDEDVNFISHSYSIGDVLKIGIKFTSATTFKLFIDGLEIYEETSGESKTWDFNSVLIGQLRVEADTGNRNPCDVLMLFNEALSDSELETLTSYTSFNKMAKALLYTIE